MPQFDFTWNDAPVDYNMIAGYIIEFGDQNTSVADVVIASANNASTANISVQFLDCSPNHVITTRDGDKSPPQRVEFRFSQLLEHDANNTALRVFNFSEAIFFARHESPSQPTSTQHFFFTGSIPYLNGSVSEPKVSFTFTLFDEAAIVSYADGILSIPSSSVKWEMEISGWQVVEGHTLELKMGVAAAPSVVSVLEDVHGNVEESVQILLTMGDGLAVSLVLPTRTVIDANETVMLAEIPAYDAATSQVRFVFPAFEGVLIYDPSASILLGGDTGGSSSSVGIGLLIGLTVGLAGLAFVVTLIGFLSAMAVVIYNKVAKPRAQLREVNWSGEQTRNDAL